MITSTFTAINSSSFCKKNTGLGNVLFQIASTFGIAKESNLEYCYKDFPKLLEKLNSVNLENYDKTIFRNIPKNIYNPKKEFVLSEKDSQLYEKNLLEDICKNISIYDSFLLDGYFQSYKYFHKYREDILKLFSIDENTKKYIFTKYPFINDKCISIHLRQHYGTTYKYNREYYLKCIAYINYKYNGEKKILVFSDDIEDAKSLFDNFTNFYFINETDYIDMWIMSLCSFNIISHSTLSWWGSYLNTNKDKIVFYPEDALRIHYGRLYNTPVCIERMNDFYLPDWLCVRCKIF